MSLFVGHKKMKKTIIFLVIFLFSIQFAHAKARFMGLEEVVAVSDFIGIVEVTSSEIIGEPFQENLPQKGYWQYSQKNIFKILSIIKTSPIVSVDTNKQQLRSGPQSLDTFSHF